MPATATTAQIAVALATLVVAGDRAHDTGNMATLPADQPFRFLFLLVFSHTTTKKRKTLPESNSIVLPYSHHGALTPVKTGGLIVDGRGRRFYFPIHH